MYTSQITWYRQLQIFATPFDHENGFDETKCKSYEIKIVLALGSFLDFLAWCIWLDVLLCILLLSVYESLLYNFFFSDCWVIPFSFLLGKKQSLPKCPSLWLFKPLLLSLWFLLGFLSLKAIANSRASSSMALLLILLIFLDCWIL